MTYMQLTGLNLSHQGHEEETILVIIPRDCYFKLIHRITMRNERLNFYIFQIFIHLIFIFF